MKMRKIVAIAIVAAFAVAGCKKKLNTVSKVVQASYPIIKISGSPYISIPVGGAANLPNATAVDTYYKENPTVVKHLGTLDNTKPGLYTVTYSAKNSNGFEGTANVYVAVTDVSDTFDLSGWYWRPLGPDSSLGRSALVTKLARGLFMTSNVGGVDTADASTGAVVSAVFAVTSLSSIDFGTQLTSVGTLSAFNTALNVTPPDTSIAYSLDLTGFGSQIRKFYKQ